MTASDEQGGSSWALWRHWRGAPDLIAHVARKSIGAVARSGPGARLAIDLHVDGDVESFASADEFSSRATEQGLRDFALLRVHASNDVMSVDLSIVRRPLASGPDWLDEGVLLEVRNVIETPVEARDVIATAVSRGKLFQKRPSETGDDRGTLEQRATSMRQNRRTRRTLRRIGVGLPLLWGAVCVGLFTTAALGGDGSGSTTTAVGLGAFVGLTVPLFAVGAFPNIAISTLSRRGLILRGLSGLPVGALIGLLADSL